MIDNMNDYYKICLFCQQGNLEELKKIKVIEKYINGIKENDAFKSLSPLGISIVNEKFDISAYLLSLGADINMEYENSEKYLVSIIHSIIDEEADNFYVFNDFKYPTPINTKALEFAIKVGADINKPDGRGYTPLDWTKEYNHYTGAEILFKIGAKHSKYFFEDEIKKILANKNLKAYFEVYPHFEGLTVEDCLTTKKTYKKPKVYVYHRELNRVMNNYISGSSKSLELGFFDVLINKNFNINEKDEFEKTPLDFAIELKHFQAVEFLKNHGAKTAKELESDSKK